MHLVLAKKRERELCEDDLDEVILEEEGPLVEEFPGWLAVAKVRIETGYTPYLGHA
jgi:hypothetical protein